MSYSRHRSYTAHPSNQPPAPECVWCRHDVRGDLQPAITSWDRLVIECRDHAMCDMRSAVRGLDLGLHLEDVL